MMSEPKRKNWYYGWEICRACGLKDFELWNAIVSKKFTPYTRTGEKVDIDAVIPKWKREIEKAKMTREQVEKSLQAFSQRALQLHTTIDDLIPPDDLTRLIHARSAPEIVMNAIFKKIRGFIYKTDEVSVFGNKNITDKQLRNDQAPPEQKSTKEASQELIELISQVAPEVENIFNAIKSRVGFPPHGVADIEKKWKDAGVAEFKAHKKEYNHVKLSHLNRKIYSLNPGKEKRDFMGKIFLAIAKDREFKHHGGYQNLYAIYSRIKKSNNKH